MNTEKLRAILKEAIPVNNVADLSAVGRLLGAIPAIVDRLDKLEAENKAAWNALGMSEGARSDMKDRLDKLEDFAGRSRQLFSFNEPDPNGKLVLLRQIRLGEALAALDRNAGEASE